MAETCELVLGRFYAGLALLYFLKEQKIKFTIGNSRIQFNISKGDLVNKYLYQYSSDTAPMTTFRSKLNTMTNDGEYPFDLGSWQLRWNGTDPFILIDTHPAGGGREYYDDNFDETRQVSGIRLSIGRVFRGLMMENVNMTGNTLERQLVDQLNHRGRNDNNHPQYGNIMAVIRPSEDDAPHIKDQAERIKSQPGAFEALEGLLPSLLVLDKCLKALEPVRDVTRNLTNTIFRSEEPDAVGESERCYALIAEAVMKLKQVVCHVEFEGN
jgi:hypothetical protein